MIHVARMFYKIHAKLADAALLWPRRVSALPYTMYQHDPKDGMAFQYTGTLFLVGRFYIVLAVIEDK